MLSLWSFVDTLAQSVLPHGFCLLSVAAQNQYSNRGVFVDDEAGLVSGQRGESKELGNI